MDWQEGDGVRARGHGMGVPGRAICPSPNERLFDRFGVTAGLHLPDVVFGSGFAGSLAARRGPWSPESTPGSRCVRGPIARAPTAHPNSPMTHTARFTDGGLRPCRR